MKKPDNPSKPPPKVHHPPPRCWFIVGWFVLLALHGLCLAYFVGVGVLYKKFLPHSTLEYQFRTYSIGISETQYPKVAVVHEVIAALHAFFILTMLGGTLQTRKFVFYPECRPLWQRTTSVVSAVTHTLRQRYLQSKTTTETRTVSSDSSVGRTISGRLSRTSEAIFGKEGLLGVDSPYFDHIMLVREFVETSLQTYQAYRMSHLLPRLWLTRVFVLLLVANCWIVPILHRVYKKRHRVRRMMSWICDVVLDLVSSMGISFFIFATYVPEYTDPHYGFPLKNFYIDEWFISLYQEFQMMVIMSWSDMGSRLVFAFGVLQGMESIKELLTDIFDEKPSNGTIVRPTTVIVPAAGPAPPLQPVITRHEVLESRVHKVVHFVLHVIGPCCFVLWGTIILVIHLYAEVHRVNLPCKLPLRPWLHTKPACSLVEISCYHQDASGSSAEKDWAVFEPSLAAGLVIRHCPVFDVPPTMQSFTGLTTLKTYNSTITSWPEAAGLTSAQAHLRAIYLIRTNFTNGILPPGLERHDFPSSVGSFVASVTNLAALPDSLDAAWPKRMSIAIEFASLTSVPDVLIRLNPTLVSFAHTPITSVPAALFEVSAIRNMLLSYTAIQEVPRNVTKLAPGFYAIALEGTNVSAFWAWMDPVIARAYALHKWYFMVANTTYCRERAEIMNGTRQQFSAVATETNMATVMDISTPSQLQYSLGSVTCVSAVKMLYPLALEDATSHIRVG